MFSIDEREVLRADDEMRAEDARLLRKEAATSQIVRKQRDGRPDPVTDQIPFSGIQIDFLAMNVDCMINESLAELCNELRIKFADQRADWQIAIDSAFGRLRSEMRAQVIEEVRRELRSELERERELSELRVKSAANNSKIIRPA